MAHHSGETLELREEGLAGYRHHLKEQAVQAGALLELLTDQGWQCAMQTGIRTISPVE